MNYRVFTRAWWKDNFTGGWPNNLEPHAGHKTILDEVETEEEARIMCAEWNNTHEKGRYSVKAEFESIN